MPETVSIVVPVFNRSDFLQEAVDSVLAQTHPDWELVLVDDGSTDNTPQTLAWIAALPALAGRARVVLGPHVGVSHARNLGVRHACPEARLLLFLDSDDLLEPDCLQTLVAALRDDPDCAAAYGRPRTVDADGQPAADRWPLPPLVKDRRFLFEQISDGMQIYPPACVLIRRWAFSTCGGFDATIESVEDYDFYCRLSLQGPFKAITRVVCQYRRHGSNMSDDVKTCARERDAVLAKITLYREGRQTALRRPSSYIPPPPAPPQNSQAFRDAWASQWGKATDEERLGLLSGLSRFDDALCRLVFETPNVYLRQEAARRLGAWLLAEPESYEAIADALRRGLADTDYHVRYHCRTALAIDPLTFLPIYMTDDRPGVLAQYAARAQTKADTANPDGLPAEMDALSRSVVFTPSSPIRAKRCIVTVTTPGYERFLEMMLTSLRLRGEVPDALIVLYAYEPGERLLEIAARFDAVVIECAPLARYSLWVKAPVYSVSRNVEADSYLILDTDILITESLEPLFLQAEASPGTIMAVPNANGENCEPIVYPDGKTHIWQDALTRYQTNKRALKFMTGKDDLPRPYLDSNVGVVAGGKAAFDAFDRQMRSMWPASAIILDIASCDFMDEMVANISLSRGRWKALPIRWNTQLYAYPVLPVERDGRLTFVTENGQESALLHFVSAPDKQATMEKVFARIVENDALTRKNPL